MMPPLKAAALQMATSDDVAANARKLHAAIEDAAEAGAQVLVTPECAVSGYLPRPDLDLAAAQRSERELAAHAAEHKLWLALGTTTQRDGRRYNTALLYSPDGRPIGSYDKTHLMPGDRPVFAPGGELPIFKLGDWTVALQICFDMRFAENWRILRRKGAEVVLHLSNASAGMGWKAPVLDGTVRCRAAENGMFVVSANDARPPQMMASAICDPDGLHLACAELNEETMIFAELDPSKLRTDYLEARRTDLWRRPDNRDLLTS